MSNELHLNRRRLLLGGTAGAAALALGACSRTEAGGGGLLQSARDGGTVRVAYADEAPYAYTGEDGAVTGSSVDTQLYLLDRLGIKADQIEWTLTEWDSLITGLGTNHDMVIAGMYVTPERCEAVAFANPEYVMPDALMTLAGNPGGYTDFNTMAETDGVVGVMNGTSEQEIADQLYPEDRINVQADLDSLILELKAGRCDAIALTSANLRLAAEEDPGLEVSEGFWLVDPATGEDIIGAGAAVFQPGDTDFRDAVNEELEQLVADPAKWEELTGPYGFTVEENLPEGVTAEELCPDTYQ